MAQIRIVEYNGQEFELVRIVMTQFGPCAKLVPIQGGRVFQVFMHQVKEVFS